jgi:hypothetical protein
MPVRGRNARSLSTVREKTMKKLLAVFCASLLANTAGAAGYTSWAVPTLIENVNGGTLITGSFGDPGGCGEANYIFVRQSASNYKEVVAMAYVALVGGRQLMFYAASCTSVSFHWGPVNNINLNSDGHTAQIR